MRRTTSILFFLFGVLFPEALAAQQNEDLRQYYFREYSVDQGLPQSQVNAIFEDSRGYLWMATQGGGIARFDGRDFFQYEEKEGLAGQIANCITEDDKGNIWIGTSWGGLSKFNGKSFKVFTKDDGLSSTEIKSVLFDKASSRIWVGVHWGLFYQEGEKMISFPGFDQLDVNYMVQEESGKILAGTSNGVFVIENDKSFLLPGTAGLAIRHLSLDTASLWITTDAGLMRLSLKDYHNIELPRELLTHPDFAGVGLTCTHIDKFGQTWIATEGRGVFMISEDELMHFGRHNGLGEIPVSCIYTDRSGQTWFGTKGNGVIRFSGFAFSNYNGIEGFGSPDIFGITKDKEGVLWVATINNGLFSYNGKSIRNFTEKEGLPSNLVRQIVLSKSGNLLLATKEGFCIYDGKRFRVITEKDGLSSSNIRCLIEAKDGSVWLGTAGGGLIRWTENEIEIFTVTNGLNHDFVHSLLQDAKGNIWIGTGAGLVKYAEGIFSSYGVPEGLCNTYVGSMAEDRWGNIWVGTDKCISRFNGRRFTNYDVFDGLGSNTIYLLAMDKTGSLIVGTNKGFDRISFSAYGQISSIRNYGRNDGFMGIECNNKSVYVDENGEIWFGTVRGLIRFNPEEELESVVRPYIHLVDVRLFHDEKWKKDVSPERLNWFGLPEHFDFRHDQNTLNFEYSGICMRYPENLEYSYMLEGFEKKWSPLTASTDATYSNLAPGDYMFRVKVRSKTGLWSIPEARFSFTIQPAFYQTWWFFLLLLVTLVYGVYYFNTIMQRNVLRQNELLEEKVNIRTREIVKQKEEKELLLKEIHHRVKNNLQVIVSLLNIHGDYIRDKESLALLEDSKSRIKSMALIHEKLYEGKNFSKVNIGEYLDTLVQELVETYGTDTKIHIDRDIKADNFGFDTIIPLGLLLNEIVSNTLKYAFPGREEGTLIFHLKGSGNQFEMVVGDDGIGISKETFLTSNATLGVDLIRILVEQLNGTIELLDVPGTRYKIRFESIDKQRI